MVTKRRFANVRLSLAAFVLATAAAIPCSMAAPQAADSPASEPTGQTEAASPTPAPADSAPASASTSAAGQATGGQTGTTVATPAAATPQPFLLHAAVYSAPPGESFGLKASFDHPELARKAVAFVRTAKGVERLIEFKRSNASDYVAMIPAELMKAPGIAYAIEIEHVNGSRIAAFASRTAPHPVTVIEDITDTRERALLARLGGRRSIISVGGEYVGFGSNESTIAIPCGDKQGICKAGDNILPAIDEHYYRIEAGYTYRSLRTVSEFGFRLGVLRGRSLKYLTTYVSDDYNVGLNFGAARVRFRILDLWQFEGELLTSITEAGFSSGFNLATHIGDPYGTKLILGFERLGITGVTFGNRIYSRMDIASGSRLVVSPIIEISDMPNARTFGVRLLAEVSIKITDGFSAQLRGGYQARKFDSGGPGVGGSLSYAF